MAKLLIITGIMLLILGLTWHFSGSLPFGKLPGDFKIEKGNMTIWVPLTSCLLISGAFSVILALWRFFIK